MTELATIEYEQPLAKVVEGIAEADRIAATFAPHFRALRSELPIAMAVGPDDPGKARAVRLVLRNIRTASERDRKALKESSLRTGKAIDGAHALLEKMLLPAEEAMREIEEAEERREAARKQALVVERTALLSPYCDPRHFALGEMTQEAFDALLAGQRAQAAARAEAEAKAKADAEAAEAARREQEKAEKAERLRLWNLAEEQRKKAAEIEAQAARERAEAKAKIAAAEAEAAELRRQQEAAAKAERDRLAAEAERARAAAAAPDAEKLGEWILAMSAIPRPEMATADGMIVADWIATRFDEFCAGSVEVIDGMTK